MEEIQPAQPQNQVVQPPQPTPMITPQPVVTNNTPWLLITLILILAGVASFFGYQNYQLRQSLSNQTDNKESEQTIVAASPTITPQPTMSPTLPSGWTYLPAVDCDVSFAIPPKQKPYLGLSDNRFWDFPRGAAYPNMLTKVVDYAKIKQAITMYASSQEAGGYIAQSIAVSCSPNNGQFANNEQLMSKLTSAITEYNSSTGEKGMQASTYTIGTQKATKRWDKSAIDLTVQEDSKTVQYTLFVTPEYIYEVKQFGDTDDSFVKQTGKQIFDLLQFK